jgi:cellulose synthase/poly-beta-1,6-N-acetylglucosamine synthase-like glycosyltransferase
VSRILFWGAAATVVYAYAGFPALVLLRARLRPRPYRTDDILPRVSLVLAAYNEAAGIRAKLDNLLALDYPHDRLELIVVSDGSDDGTDEIVASCAKDGVRLIALPRSGKATALNTAVAAATGEIVVFSDANSLYAPDAVRRLVRPFADPEVGGVAGNQVYLPPEGTDATAVGEGAYWQLDRLLKEAQSRSGSAIGATGAIYAIRRELFAPIPEGVTDDFVTSLRVVAQHRRLVFAADAVAYEPVSETREVEFGRRVRIMTRGLRCVLVMRELLDPRRHGFFALQLFSHKVLQRTAVIPLGVMAAATPALWSRGAVYKLAALGQAAVYGAGLVGVALEEKPVGRNRLLALPAYFCMINAASARAVWNIVRGRRIERWQPQRPS